MTSEREQAEAAPTARAAAPASDRRARLVAAFVGGARSGVAYAEELRWSREDIEHTLDLCDRIEQLDLPAAYLVVQLACGGRHPLSLEEAVATVEAVCQPAEGMNRPAGLAGRSASGPAERGCPGVSADGD